MFLVWQVMLLVIGLSQLNGLTRLKTWLAVLLVVLVAILSVAGLSSILDNFSGAMISSRGHLATSMQGSLCLSWVSGVPAKRLSCCACST